MNLNLKRKTYLVTGATSGFGRGVVDQLIKEEANIIAVARSESDVWELEQSSPQVLGMPGDVTNADDIQKVADFCQTHKIHGAFINAGGPPAKTFLETSLEDWDNGYQTLIRWKVDLTKKLIPLFKKIGKGRLVYLESASVKQPIENLALSNSLRMAVVGFAKTLSYEVANDNITVNVLAPGYHKTAAINRLIDKKAQSEGKTTEEVLNNFEQSIPLGKMGNPDDLGALVAWLFSEYSKFITGQVITLDGGVSKNTL